jgi:outer membrane protein TolC
LVAGDEQLLRTREALAVLLGRERGVGVASSFVLDGLVHDVGGDCASVPSEERSDLVAARESLLSAERGLGQARAGYLPTLGVTSSLVGYTTDPDLGRFATWNIAAVLSVPIWEGGTRGGVVQERRGGVTQAEAALEATRRQVLLEVARARRGVAVAEQLVSTAERGRELAAELDRMTRRAFEAGRGTSLELVQSAQALRQADVLLATRQFELVQARLDAFLTEARCDW